MDEKNLGTSNSGKQPRTFIIAAGKAGAQVIEPFVHFLSTNGVKARTEEVVPVLVELSRDNDLLAQQNLLENYQKVQSSLGNERSCFYGFPIKALNQIVKPGAPPQFAFFLQRAEEDANALQNLAQYHTLSETSKDIWRAYFSDFGEVWDAVKKTTDGKANVASVLVRALSAPQKTLKSKSKAGRSTVSKEERLINFSDLFKTLANVYQSGDRIVIVASPVGGIGTAVAAQLLSFIRSNPDPAFKDAHAALIWALPYRRSQFQESLVRTKIIQSYFKSTDQLDQVYLIHHSAVENNLTSDYAALALLDYIFFNRNTSQAENTREQFWTGIARFKTIYQWLHISEKGRPVPIDLLKKAAGVSPGLIKSFREFIRGFESALKNTNDYINDFCEKIEKNHLYYPYLDKPINVPYKPYNKSHGKVSVEYPLEFIKDKMKTGSPEEVLAGMTELAVHYCSSQYEQHSINWKKGKSAASELFEEFSLPDYPWNQMSRWVPSPTARVWIAGMAVEQFTSEGKKADAAYLPIIENMISLTSTYAKKRGELFHVERWKPDPDNKGDAFIQSIFSEAIETLEEIRLLYLKPAEPAPEDGETEVEQNEVRSGPTGRANDLSKGKLVGVFDPELLWVPTPGFDMQLLPPEFHLSLAEGCSVSDTVKQYIRQEYTEGLKDHEHHRLLPLLDRLQQKSFGNEPGKNEGVDADPDHGLWIFQSERDDSHSGVLDLWYAPSFVRPQAPPAVPPPPPLPQFNPWIFLSQNRRAVLVTLMSVSVVIFAVKWYLMPTPPDKDKIENPINISQLDTPRTIGRISYPLTVKKIDKTTVETPKTVLTSDESVLNDHSFHDNREALKEDARLCIEGLGTGNPCIVLQGLSRYVVNDVNITENEFKENFLQYIKNKPTFVYIKKLEARPDKVRSKFYLSAIEIKADISM